MTTVAHSALTGAELHESKGTAAASAGAVFIADGAGSGSYQTKFGNYTTTAADKSLNKIALTTYVPDIGTAGDTYIVTPIAGNITNIYSTVDVAPATANTILSFHLGGTLVTSGNITVPFSGSAAGDVANSSPSGNRTMSAGQALKITSDGGASNVVPAHITVYLDVT